MSQTVGELLTSTLAELGINRRLSAPNLWRPPLGSQGASERSRCTGRTQEALRS
jgi:hypothetical protein